MASINKYDKMENDILGTSKNPNSVAIRRCSKNLTFIYYIYAAR
jgi:hypothetical protein